MFLTKLLQAPMHLFQKNVISFLVIRRYDLKDTEDILRYIAVKPKASIFNLKQKLWHLLDLPDFCDEVIVLRTNNGIEIPLDELRRGNKPEHPFILEVWSPRKVLSSFRCNGEDKMLTCLANDSKNTFCEIATVNTSVEKSLDIHDDHEEKFQYECNSGRKEDQSFNRRSDRIDFSSMGRSNKFREFETKGYGQDFTRDFNFKTDLSCKMSSSSIRFKIPGRKKEKDNFTFVLQKIQNDLTALSSKIGVLENKIPT